MKIEIYTKDACPFCVQAKNLFKSKGLEYTEHYISADNRDAMIAELTQRIGQTPRTVPQIFIDDECIGGFDQLKVWAAKQPA
jgi:glutaredoxin